MPQSPKAAVVTVALFAMTSSWFNWGFSLAFSAVWPVKSLAASRRSITGRWLRRACLESAVSGPRA